MFNCSGHNAPAKEKHPPYSTLLSLEQSKCFTPGSADSHITDRAAVLSFHHLHLFLLNAGRVFVTYEADNDKHVNEIINFVALLRHNGFDTHVRAGFLNVLNTGTV